MAVVKTEGGDACTAFAAAAQRRTEGHGYFCLARNGVARGKSREPRLPAGRPPVDKQQIKAAWVAVTCEGFRLRGLAITRLEAAFYSVPETMRGTSRISVRLA